MSDRIGRAVAVVGVGALLPDAPDAPTFWKNVCDRRYSITDVPPERWSVEEYYDPDPSAPDKTYSKIGGWIRGYTFDWRRYKIPPKVAEAMDPSQQWAVTVAAEALADYGFPGRALDLERTGVVLGAAMGGELQYLTTLRVMFPEFRRALERVGTFAELPDQLRRAIVSRWHEAVRQSLPPITEDSMPGELANIISGRIANVLNLRGPSFTTDAACASSFAAIDAAVDLLTEHHCDAVLTGGVDRNMGASAFVKFCKIGALSATGSRPFGEGADGFVMGEGAAVFLLKRLADAERDGDRIYAVVRGVGASSDGKGKGITAPNPIGQKLAVERAWNDAGLDPATAGLVEAHGTSTKVGDVVEVESLSGSFASAGRGAIALGSVKSNLGHLKAGAGAAGMLKAVLALRHEVLPPTLNAVRPNPSIDFRATPFKLNHEVREWPKRNGTPRRAGVSAYGFGGTNFHVVLEEHVPGMGRAKDFVQVRERSEGRGEGLASISVVVAKPPLRGILALGADGAAGLRERLARELARVKDGALPPRSVPSAAELGARERLVVDFERGEDLVDKLERARRALETDAPAAWKALANKGVFRGAGRPGGKIAFLFPGQGSQFVNMGRSLYDREPVVRAVFDEADAILAPILGRPLTSFLFADPTDEAAVARAEQELRQTAITQPAVLTVDNALRALLAEYGMRPDYVMGHSLGEYGALVAAGAMPFADALEATAARGREMTRVSLADNGWMAAVSGPLEVIEKTLASIDGYVVTANINSRTQAVIGGETEAVKRAIAALEAQRLATIRLPVSHAFHTRIVAPAAEPLGKVLDRLRISSARLPVVANVTGELYPEGPKAIREMLVQQIAAPVQWVRGLETLWREGVRTFIEVGPKKTVKGFVDDVLDGRDGLVSLYTNHPKVGEIATFNQALCGLYAAGYGAAPEVAPPVVAPLARAPSTAITGARKDGAPEDEIMSNKSVEELAQVLARTIAAMAAPTARDARDGAFDRNGPPTGSVVVTGCGLGLPGPEKPVMDPQNVERILRGEQFIDLLPARFRELMARKHVTRVVKSAEGDGRFETIEDSADVLKLAGRSGSFDLVAEYGVPEKLVEALDSTTQLAIAAGIDALREAGIPLVQTWRKTSKGTFLPDRWALPESMRDETGVIFGSAFPGCDRFAEELRRYYTYESRRARRASLEEVRCQTSDPGTLAEIQRQLAQIDEDLRREPYAFDRRFLLRILPMGHSQFAEYIGARGPNALANAACASTAQAIAMAEDWIRTGRCRRVVVIAADNPTSDNLMEWIGAGFLATGAAATDDKVEEAALPFDRRRHGMIVGMGAAALVVESQDAVEERGMRGIVELLSSETRNSAFHATRLSVDHVAAVVESLVRSAERRFGLDRRSMAPQTVFMSHETFTPARGGSASAEVAALRRVFGGAASEIVVSNTKGFTGHAMGVGVEDVIAVKILEHGIVPPVPNFREEDPELGLLNLSRGGRYPVNYAIHLAAGFGSQIALTLTRRIPGGTERIDRPDVYRRWLDGVTGLDQAETEVVKRTLRTVSDGAPGRAPQPATWEWGTGPTRRAPAPPAFSAERGVAAPATARVPPAPARPVALPPSPLAAPAPAVAPAVAPAPPPVVNATPTPTPTPAPAAAAILSARPERSDAAPVAKSKEEGPAAPDPVTARVVAIVAEKTGYPADLLDLDLDLEADLGVDTVKQAETFAAVREEWSIPRIENLKLRDFPTLRHVVGFVRTHRPDLAPSKATATPPPAPASTATAAPAAPQAYPLSNADHAPRRVATPVLRPPLDLCKSTGVRLGAGVRIVVAGTSSEHVLAQKLADLGATALELDARQTAAAIETTLRGWLAEGPVHGVFWLPPLDPEARLQEMTADNFRERTRVLVKNLASTMRVLYESIASAGTFLVTATRLGGVFGLGEEGTDAPLGGAVQGFVKAYKRERRDALVKVVDFPIEASTAEIADVLVAEALADPGIVEVGRRAGARWSIGLDVRPVTPSPASRLDRDSVFVVTGAAGGITSAIVADLAASSGGTFHLLDLAAPPAADDPHVALFRAGRDRLKEALITEAKARGDKPTPVAIDRHIMAVERQEAALRAVASVRAAGGTAHWHTVDLLDAASVASAVDAIRSLSRRIDVLVHAAGIEISRALPDKPDDEWARVFDIKADGFFALLRAMREVPLGATVVFSSVAGRFGNAGQTDYSAANALLCAMTRALRRSRPGTRGIAIDWTAWGGIGMATRGSIPKVMEAAGIDMLAPEVGIPTVRRELLAGTADELVVGGRLGMLVEEWDATGGLDPEKAKARLAERVRPLTMVGKVTGAPLYGGLLVETLLDPSEQPFLRDHQIDAVPVLPGVMGMEAFAQVASLLCPDRVVTSLRDVEFLSPFKFHRMKPVTLHLAAIGRPAAGDAVLVEVELSSRLQPNPELPVQERLHFRGRVQLDRVDLPRKTVAFHPPTETTVGEGPIYRVYFHGPAYRVLEGVLLEDGFAIGFMRHELPPNASDPGAAELAAPRLIELCFQTAGIFDIAQRHVFGLPAALESVRVCAEGVARAAGKPLFAEVLPREDADGFDARVVDSEGNVCVELSGYRTVAIPEPETMGELLASLAEGAPA